MDKNFKMLVNKPHIKSVILSMLTLIIGGVCSALGSWDFKNDKFIIIKIILLVILTIIYIFFTIHYSKNEVNTNKINGLYKNQNAAFEELISGIISLCKESANGANDIIHDITSNGKVNLGIWNFDKACQSICNNVYDMLCKSGKGREFEVIYDRLVEDNNPPEFIYTNAYANKDKRKPSIYKVKRKITEDGYHDIELFNLGKADLDVLIGEEIDDAFSHQNKEQKVKNKHKYSQYIAIPVFCNDEKMIGLFEVVCMNNTKIGDTKEDIKEFASRYLMSYSFLLLLLHKMEKALLAKPN